MLGSVEERVKVGQQTQTVSEWAGEGPSQNVRMKWPAKKVWVPQGWTITLMDSQIPKFRVGHVNINVNVSGEKDPPITNRPLS